MKSLAQDLDQLRKFYTENARQILVEGVANTVAVGYVREWQGKVSYVVFYGKQSKPAKHYASRSVELAEQRVTELLGAAGRVATQRAADRKQPRAAYHERTSEGVTTRSYSTAGTAQLIREALKVAFPGVKFSVTSDTFANGSSVDIAYTDGPSSRQVEAVYDRFKSGSFDSSQDMYEYNQGTTVVDGQGQLVHVQYGAKYISARRSYSPTYGFFLNALDLREQPTLAVQFATFYQWHSRQQYNTLANWGEQAGTYTVSSDSSRGDLERFAAALTAQGYAPTLSQEGYELTLTLTTPAGEEPRPVQPEASTVASAAQPDQTEREFAAAEMHWLSDPGQDSTDREFEAAERAWLRG